MFRQNCERKKADGFFLKFLWKFRILRQRKLGSSSKQTEYRYKYLKIFIINIKTVFLKYINNYK